MLKGDITAALGYNTPAGGAVVTSVAPCGIGDRGLGTLGFTTSLGFGRKLERIVADPRIALAYHAREHGYSASPAFVLAQGTASVDLTPSRARLEALTPQVEHYLGKVMRGPVAPFWQAARELDPEVDDESDLAGAREGDLARLCAQAGLGQVQAGTLTVRARHATFDEYWEPFTLGVGPAGAYAASLDAERRDLLRERCRRLVPAEPIEMTATVWAVTCRT